MPTSLPNAQLSNTNPTRNNDKSILNDDQNDSPISERTSMASSIDENRPAPPSSPIKSVDQTTSRKPRRNNLRYSYNELPANGIPLATQYRIDREQEKKNMSKAPPGQGSLVPLPEDSTTFYENYYPYTRYFQTKNAGRIARTKEIVTNPTKKDDDDIDVTPYLPDRSSVGMPVKRTRRRRRGRRRRRDDDDDDYYYSSRSRNDFSDSKSSSSKQYIPLKDPDDSQSGRTTSRHRHHHHHHRHHRSQLFTRPPINDPYTPNRMYENSEFNVIDDSYKRTERSPFIRGTRHPYELPPPAIYNQDFYLPPIYFDYSSPANRWAYSVSRPFRRDWNETRAEPKVHQPDTETRFYDRYLNNVIAKRLTAL